MGKYKDKQGTSKVGDFLRSINKSGIVAKAISIVGSGATGGLLGVLGDIIGKDDTLTSEQRSHALKLLEQDRIEMEEITKRWEADLNSDSWMSKNIRPYTLAFLSIMIILLVILDAAMVGFTVDETWVNLLKMSYTTVLIAFFGSRGIEKIQKTRKQ